MNSRLRSNWRPSLRLHIIIGWGCFTEPAEMNPEPSKCSVERSSLTIPRFDALQKVS
jgi:hypothetical protein